MYQGDSPNLTLCQISSCEMYLRQFLILLACLVVVPFAQFYFKFYSIEKLNSNLSLAYSGDVEFQRQTLISKLRRGHSKMVCLNHASFERFRRKEANRKKYHLLKQNLKCLIHKVLTLSGKSRIFLRINI